MNITKGGLFYLALFLSATSTLLGQTANDYFSQALEKQKAGDLDGAIADYRKGLELKPDEFDAYVDRGIAKSAKGDLDGAIGDYTKAIEIKPDAADVYCDRGNAKSDKGDKDGALTDLSKAIDLDPKYADSYFDRANIRYMKGDPDGAIADLTKAIELNPNDPQAYCNRGTIYYDRQDFTNSLADFRSAIANRPNDNYAHFHIWLIRAQQGEKDAAKLELDQYIENAPTPDEWTSRVGQFLQGKMSEDTFLQLANEISTNDKKQETSQAYFYAGSTRMIDGDLDTAEGYFKQCMTLGNALTNEYYSAEA